MTPAPIVNRPPRERTEYHADLNPIVNRPPRTPMSRSAKSVQAESVATMAAITQAQKEAERADAGLRAAEARLVAAATTGNEVRIGEAESGLRNAEAVRASVVRRTTLLEMASRALEAELEALDKGDRVKALQAQRTGLEAKFCEAEESVGESLSALSVALSKLEQAYQTHRVCGRELEDLGLKSDQGDRTYGPWSGAAPYPHGTRLVERAFALAGERLGAVATIGAPIAINVPVFAGEVQ